MAFPAVANANSGTGTTVSWTGGSAGDLVLFVFRSSGGGTLAASGFSVVVSDTTDASDDSTYVFYKYLTGTQTSIGVTGSSGNTSWAVYRITGTDGATAPTASAVTVGTTTSINPANCNPGSSKDYLWVVTGGEDGKSGSMSVVPSGYSTVTESAPTGAGSPASWCAVWLTNRTNTASSEDPDAATIANPNSGACIWTLAVHPSSVVANNGVADTKGEGKTEAARRLGAVRAGDSKGESWASASATVQRASAATASGEGVLAVVGTYGVPSNAEASGEGAISTRPQTRIHYDFFDRFTLGSNWTTTSGTWTIVTQQLYAGLVTSAARFNEPANTIAQYVKLQAVNPSSLDYIGASFRMQSGGTVGAHYRVYLGAGGLSADWYAANNDTIGTLIEGLGSGGPVINPGYWVGFTCEGAGDDTVIKAWVWSTDPDTGRTPDIEGRWGSPDLTFTANPGGNAVDSGFYCGVATNYGLSVPRYDNFWGGDIISAVNGATPRVALPIGISHLAVAKKMARAGNAAAIGEGAINLAVTTQRAGIVDTSGESHLATNPDYSAGSTQYDGAASTIGEGAIDQTTAVQRSGAASTIGEGAIAANGEKTGAATRTATASGEGAIDHAATAQRAGAAAASGEGAVSNTTISGGTTTYIPLVWDTLLLAGAKLLLSVAEARSAVASGQGAVDHAVTAQRAGASAASGEGAVDHTAITQRAAAATTSGEGAVDHTAITQRAAAATTSGEGAVGHTAITQRIGVSTASGEGAIAAVGERSGGATRSAAASGEGVVNHTATAQRFGAVATTGEGAVGHTATAQRFDAASATGEGAVAAAAQKSGAATRAADISGTGVLAATAVRQSSQAATLRGEGAIQSTRSWSVSRQADTTGAGTCAVAALVQRAGIVSASGTGQTQNQFSAERAGSATAVGNGLLSVAYVQSGNAIRSAQVWGEGQLSADRKLVALRSSSSIGEASLASSSHRDAPRATEQAGTGQLAVVYQLAAVRAASAAGTGVSAVARRAQHGASATVSGQGQSQSTRVRDVPRSGASSGTGLAQVISLAEYRRQVAAQGSGAFTSLPAASGFAGSRLDGQGRISTSPVLRYRVPSTIWVARDPSPVLIMDGEEIPRVIVAREASGSIRRFFAKKEAA